MKLSLWALFLVSSFSFAAESVAAQCACQGGTPTPELALAKSDVAFVGKVVSSQRGRSENERSFETEVRFQVKEVWKRDLSRSVVVRISSETEIVFRAAEEWLVFAKFAQDGMLEAFVHCCTKTKPLYVVADYPAYFKKIGEEAKNVIESEGPINVENYLRSYLDVLGRRRNSLRNRLVGFIPITPSIESRLISALPNHRFHVAKTLYSHWSPDDGSANILVVTESASGDVVGHIWAIWFSGRNETFDHLLQGYQARSTKDAVEMVRTLSSVIASLKDSTKVDGVRIKNRIITAEFFWGGRPWRELKVEIDKDHRFGRIAFVNSVSGKEEVPEKEAKARSDKQS